MKPLFLAVNMFICSLLEFVYPLGILRPPINFFEYFRICLSIDLAFVEINPRHNISFFGLILHLLLPTDAGRSEARSSLPERVFSFGLLYLDRKFGVVKAYP